MKDNKNEKEKILVVADKLFRDNGLYKTSMDELAALLQISKKTIYKHFPSKENLVKEITKFWMTGSTKRVDIIVHSKTDVVSKFVKLLEDYSCELSKVSDKWVRDFQIHYPDIWKSVEEFREEKIFYYVRKLFKQGLKEKFVLNIPAELVITSHIASMRAIDGK
jgi:AcrR family transcriptional regulator